MDKKIYFEKVKDDATRPTKRKEDGGYDVFACFEEEELIIESNDIRMIPTGIATAFDEKYVALVRERGSTGTEGMSVRAGVIDSGYRGEWFIPINNTTNKKIIISKKVKKLKKVEEEMHNYFNNETYTIKEFYYPYRKAIAQFILTRAYHFDVEEVDNIKQFDSKRGEGRLGSSEN